MNKLAILPDNQIKLVRGDYLEIDLYINIGDNICPQNINFLSPEYRDFKVFFGLMEPNLNFENSILYKQYLIDDSFIEDLSNFTENGDLIIKLNSEDTINLHPGVYYYSIKIQNPNTQQINTIINKNIFNIM